RGDWGLKHAPAGGGGGGVVSPNPPPPTRKQVVIEYSRTLPDSVDPSRAYQSVKWNVFTAKRQTHHPKV
ncbi:MAG: hypothetical protein P4L84_13465, partial [Isosphaeraceae bacterium]|nr:hypothetical protein [Isosphaeraceae bacterium]